MLRKIVAVTAAATALLGTGATTAAADIVQPSTDTTAMAQSIGAAFAGNTVGFAFVIAKNGQYAAGGAGGKARTGPDGNVNMATTTRIEIASATKNITAAAVLKLLEANGLNPDTPIRAYWPTSFKLTAHLSWNNVTFRHLLTHTSGLEQMEQNLTAAESANWTTLYSGLQFAVTKQISAPSPGLYSNMNYAMLRILIPALWRLADPGRGVPLVNSTNSGTWALAYVNENLLAPAGIATAACVPANPASAALAYDANNTGAGGYQFQLTGSNGEACAGHRGLHLSAMDLTRWQAHLAHGSVVSATVRAQMDAGKLGWRGGSNSGANLGIFFHDGDLSVGQQLHTCHAKFPGGIEASAVINSQNLAGVRVCTVLINAFKAAS